MKSNSSSVNDICISLLDCAYDFQTLIAALIALLSVYLVGRAALKAARLPILAEDRRAKNQIERRRQFSCRLLSEEFMRICELARQAEGTIKVVGAAGTNITDETRNKTIIVEPPFLDDWQTMSLLSQGTLTKVMEARATLRRHNFDMQRAGGPFGSDTFRKVILKQVKQLMHKSLAVSSLLKNEALHGVHDDE